MDSKSEIIIYGMFEKEVETCPLQHLIVLMNVRSEINKMKL